MPTFAVRRRSRGGCAGPKRKRKITARAWRRGGSGHLAAEGRPPQRWPLCNMTCGANAEYGSRASATVHEAPCFLCTSRARIWEGAHHARSHIKILHSAARVGMAGYAVSLIYTSQLLSCHGRRSPISICSFLLKSVDRGRVFLARTSHSNSCSRSLSSVESSASPPIKPRPVDSPAFPGRRYDRHTRPIRVLIKHALFNFSLSRSFAFHPLPSSSALCNGATWTP